MDFYDRIAEYYDFIFPANEKAVQFLERIFPKKGSILDIACGTGNYANALKEREFQVWGIDLNAKMIQLASKKSSGVAYKVQNMLNIDAHDVYDGIYCIGNSLVHLKDIFEIQEALQNMYNALKPNGAVCIQIINYDRIVDQQIDHLPTIKNNDIEFVRHYEHQGEYILFQTTLIADGKTINNEERLRVLRQYELIEIMEKIGFIQTESFDGFHGTPYQIKSSQALVVTAIKPEKREPAKPTADH